MAFTMQRATTGKQCICQMETIECEEYSIRHSEHTSTWVVILWTLHAIITISFWLYFHGIFTYDDTVCSALFIKAPCTQLCTRVHIVGQRDNRYIVAFHIEISRYRTIFTASIQWQATSRPRVRRTVECAVFSAADV